MDAYPPIPPKQVTVSCVHLSSYGFLQTLSLANNALAIRIIFPLVRVTPLSFKWTGLPASLGKHKKSQYQDTGFLNNKHRVPYFLFINYFVTVAASAIDSLTRLVTSSDVLFTTS
jgi:hypothetical protein